MLLFAVNFNLYYYILMRRIGDVTHNEELRWFLGIFFAAVLTMTVANIGQFGSFGESLHHTAFNAASVYSTTGFASVNFDKWPTNFKMHYAAVDGLRRLHGFNGRRNQDFPRCDFG